MSHSNRPPTPLYKLGEKCNGYTSHMPIGQPTPIHIQQEILLRFDAYRREQRSIMDSCAQISVDLKTEHNYEMPPKSVWALLQRLRPTTDLAKMYLKAKAMKLVKRIVKRASPSEAIDLLSRPGMNVIEPAAKTQDNGPTGFFLTVQADTCGAVKIGMGAGQIQPKQIEETVAFDPFAGAVGGFDEESQASSGPRVIGRSETSQSALDRARAKIAASRRASEENEVVRHADE